jgi:hypothetical protein
MTPNPDVRCRNFTPNAIFAQGGVCQEDQDGGKQRNTGQITGDGGQKMGNSGD